MRLPTGKFQNSQDSYEIDFQHNRLVSVDLPAEQIHSSLTATRLDILFNLQIITKVDPHYYLHHSSVIT